MGKAERSFYHPSNWLAALNTEEILRLISTDKLLAPNNELRKILRRYGELDNNYKFSFLNIEDSVDENQILKLLNSMENIDYEVLNFSWLHRVKDSLELKILEKHPISGFELAYAALFKPFIYLAYHELGCILSQSKYDSNLWDTQALKQAFIQQLIVSIQNISKNTLKLEFELAHIEGSITSNIGNLDTAFIDLLLDKKYQKRLLLEYPVLTRKISEHIERWLSRANEFVDRYQVDHNQISKEFNFASSERRLIRVEDINSSFSMYSSSVLLLRFNNGKSVVYKSRSMELEARFYRLLNWYNDVSGDRLPIVRVLSRNHHGWMEYINASSIELNVKKLTRRFGSILALLYILRASDIHFENVIVKNSFPIVIDLETLFQPSSDDACSDELIGTGLLPSIELKNSGSLCDYSMGALTSIINRYMKLDLLSAPRAGWELILNKASELLSSSLANSLSTLLANKEEFFDEVLKFKEARTRFVYRDHKVYFDIINNSNHPDNLRCGIVFDQSFSTLWKDTPIASALSMSEYFALRENQFPYLVNPINLHSLESNKQEIKKNFFQTTSFDTSLKLLDKLDQQKVQQLTSIVQQSFLNLIQKLNTANQ